MAQSANACTAGAPQKHATLRALHLSALASSRAADAFAVGATRQLTAAPRAHAALNSLSADFVPASFACLAEGGAFGEIGKRSVWSTERVAAAVEVSVQGYGAIALDADFTSDPAWMQTVLQMLSRRVTRGTLSPLPFA